MKGNVGHFSIHLSWSHLPCNKSSFYRLRKIVAKSSFLWFFFNWKPNSLTSCSQQIEAICYSDLRLFKEGCFALSFPPCKVPLLDTIESFWIIHVNPQLSQKFQLPDLATRILNLDPVYMEWGRGRFLLFCVPQSVKTKETNPTRPGSPTPCKQALKRSSYVSAWLELLANERKC